MNLNTIYKMLRPAFVVLTIAMLFCSVEPALAQTGISTINTSTVSGTTTRNTTVAPDDAGNTLADDAGETFIISYGQGNNIRVSSYVVNSTTYDRFLSPDTLILNRAVSTDRLVNIWYTINSAIIDNTPPTNDSIFLDSDEAEDADAIYLTGNLNAGYDNILVNDDDLASGSIQVETERVDVIWFSGIQTSVPSTAVFPIIERGGNDNIAVAAITSLNVDGTPGSYGQLVGISENDWPGTGSSFNNYLILRREEAGGTPVPLLNIGTFAGQSAQIVQGVAVSFSELGISANTSIYGYSIFSADVVDGYVADDDNAVTSGSVSVASGVDLTDISTFPTDSKSADSGLDLVAGVSAAVASDDNLIETKGPGGYKAALSTWLKANEDADVTTSTDGSTVSDWQDHWTGDHDATTGATSNPTYRSTSSAINFNPTVDFTASTTSLSIANNTDFNTASSYTNKGLNMAFRTSDSNISTRQVLYEQGDNARSIIIYIRNGNLHVTAFNRNSDGTGSPWNNGTNPTSVSTSVSTDTEYILTIELAGSSTVNGTLTAYLNGSSFGTLSNVGLLFSDTGGIELGGSDGNTRYDDGTSSSTNSFFGEISEFIYCNEPGSFTTAQRDRIESYLAVKYGITLDQSSANDYVNSDGDIIFDATNNASIGGYLEYNNDIAGIGRDDDAELDQPASRSENDGSVVTIDRGATISTDDTWLLWGNDGAALTETDALTMPDTIVNRLTRVWRASETNETLTTSVSFDLTGLGLSTDAGDFSLMIAANNSGADFSNATVISGGTFNGNEITFTGVDLDDGEYFTLGTEYFQCAPGGVLTNLALWLRADDGTDTSVDGADIATWSDKSGDENDATAVFGNRPNYAASSINFNPAVNFDDTNTEEITGAAGFHSVAYYMVVNPDDNFTSATNNQALIGFNVPAGATDEFGALTLGNTTGAFSGEVITHAIGGTGTRWRRGISSSTIAQVNAGQTYLFGIRDNASSATSTDVFVDGLEQADLVSGSFLTSVDTDYEVGSYTATNDFLTAGHFDGQIAEVISYSVYPTDAEHNRIQSYLAIKYGITLDNSGGGTAGDYTSAASTTIWDASDYSTYHNDVAGIGRDDLSCLNQKQSQSENSGSILTIGLGEIAASNGANANTFATDNTFMVWGSDGDDIDQANANISDLPGNVTERMERIWRINETNTVGATTLQFDISGLGYSSTQSDFQLIISSSATMASGSLTPAASLDGDILTFTNVDFTDGDFFTIGTARTACGPGGVSADLETWLRADAGVTLSSSEVTAWSDQSGNSNGATSKAGNRPDILDGTLNFNNSISFNSTNVDFLAGANGGYYTQNYFMVVLPDNTISSASGAEVVYNGDRNQADAINYDGGATDFAGFVFGSFTSAFANEVVLHGVGAGTSWRSALTGTGTIPASVPYVFNVTDNSTVSPTSTDIYQDGVIVSNNTANSFVSDSDLPYMIGAYFDTVGAVQNPFDGQVAEVINFSSARTAAERRRIQSYLAIKYGITLDQSAATADDRSYFSADGTTIWNTTTNSGYDNDIAGIGRDDDGCFVQKQSKSSNSDAILTIGHVEVATDNAANTNGFSDDGDFLVWGNDDGATAEASTNTSDVPAVIAERMERIWKVQDTGTVGATELQFDLTGLGYSVADPSAFSLLVGNTATMADASIITGGTLDGNVLSFTGINLTDGQFFTLGTQYVTCGPGGVNTNIALWLRADEEVFSDAGSTAAVDGADVAQWNDQSSPADNASESNLFGASPIEPTFETNQINFNPALSFTDPNSTNSSYMETSSNSVSGDMTLISAFKTAQSEGTANDFVNSPALIGASETSGTLDYGLGMDNGTIWMNANTTTTFDAETSSLFNDNLPHFATATRTQSSGAITIYVDGNSEATGTGSTSALTDPNSFGIGNHSDGDLQAQYSGDIAETIVFSSVLSSDERNRVESYLALKYGITMNASDDGGTGGVDERDYRAADGGVIWDYTGQTSTYYNDIFGIGRDDLSCLEQTVSKSQNTDALVTIDNNGSFGTDDSFLLSGNDNAAIEAEGNTEKPATINSRLNREWIVQETGTVGSVLLTYDLSDITGPLGTGTNNANLLRLMVDDDGNFSNGGTTLISPTSINGTSNTVTFTVDFTDGDYYTLGSTEEYALPITLISFEAQVTDSEVKLNWATAQEVNNAYFAIERSADGDSFETIATMDGAGTSSIIIEYQFTDLQPLTGQSFYRLRQVDHGGKFEISEVRRVFVDSADETKFTVFPNPIERGEMIRIKQSGTSDRSSAYSYQVLTLNGTVVRSGETDKTVNAIQTAGLGTGIYLLKIKNADQPPRTYKFIIN